MKRKMSECGRWNAECGPSAECGMRSAEYAKGFTLLELAIILVLLAILAKVAIPVYQSIDNQSKAGSVRATLDEVRAALKTYRMNERLEGRPENWPSVAVLRDIDDFGAACNPGGSCPPFSSTHIFDNCDMPNNPFSDSGAPVCEHDYVETVLGIAKGNVSGSARGWRYNSTTGEFWAKSRVMGENDW